MKNKIIIIRNIVSQREGGMPPGQILEAYNYTAETPISRPTLNRWLKKWEEQGQLFVTGMGRATVYHTTPKDPKHLRMAIPAELRKPVHYRPEIFNGHTPDQTCWIPKQDKANILSLIGKRFGNASTYTRAVSGKLMADISYASSKMEGNTYTRAETVQLIESGIRAPGKTETETDMIINHRDAVEFIIQILSEPDRAKQEKLTPMLIREIHALLSRNLVPAGARGAIRAGAIGISDSAYIPETSPQILDQELRKICDIANRIRDPLEESVFLMVAIPYLQPFIDVNKRTGRMAANIPLLRAGLPPISYLGVDTDKYTDGLIQFYEFADPDPIAQSWVETYTRNLPAYLSILAIDPGHQDIARRNRALFLELAKTFGDMCKNGAKPLDELTFLVPEGETREGIMAVFSDYVENFDPIQARPDRLSEEQCKGLMNAKKAIIDGANVNNVPIRKPGSGKP